MDRSKSLNEIMEEQKSVITLIFGIIVATVAVCLMLNKYITDKVYEAKWREYDDCGMDNL